ncbi:MAG: hypothetical protein GXY41_05205 [Phycisphaerae bacterium]|nr:hypothetical protein [Phycisphaerae bacterium]
MKTKNLFFWGIVSLAFSFSSAMAANDNPPWGESLNNLRMRATLPGGNVYKKGGTVPIQIEVQNIGSEPIPLSSLHPYLQCDVHDLEGNRIGVTLSSYGHITPWEGSGGNLDPGAILKHLCHLERLRIPAITPSEIQLRFELPTIQLVPDQLPIRKYSNPLSVVVNDPIEFALKSSDLPEKWDEHLTLIYREGGSIFWGEFVLEVRPSGDATLIVSGRNRTEIGVENGTYQYRSLSSELDRLLNRLRDFTIEKMNPHDRRMYAVDLVEVHVMISYKGKTYLGSYQPDHLISPEVVEFQQIIHDFINDLKTRETKTSEESVNDNALDTIRQSYRQPLEIE